MKENELAVSEYDMIGAELYYCYNYFQSIEDLKYARYQITSQLNELREKRNTMDESVLKKSINVENITINWRAFPEFEKYVNKEVAEKNRKELLEICDEGIETTKKDNRKQWLKEIPAYLVPIIGWIAFFYDLIEFKKSNRVNVSEKIIKEIEKRVQDRIFCEYFVSELRHDLKNLEKFSKDIHNDYNWEHFINIYTTKKNLGRNGLVEIYLQNNPNITDKYNKKIEEIEKRIADKSEFLRIIDKSIEDIENEFKENMGSRNTTIPSVYHNEEDITNLIDYYVRRRGDIWKELVNEYEHDKKLNQIISSIDNLSNKVSVLTDSVIKCFNIVGMQLGIINQSILSLQNTTTINLDKISQIENQQEKRLCELTSSIQNMNVKTKVIIESR